jgi:hypothetical protein
MEKYPKKKDLEMENYMSFLNLGDFNPTPILEKCKNDQEYKKITIIHLEDRLKNEEHPELLDEKYKNILKKIYGGIAELRSINNLSLELVNEFVNENLNNVIFINNLTLPELEIFTQKALDFFDKRLSPTLLALANDDFPFLKDNLPIAREKIIKIIEEIEAGEFWKLPKDAKKIEEFKNRLDLIKTL